MLYIRTSLGSVLAKFISEALFSDGSLKKLAKLDEVMNGFVKISSR